MRRGFGIIQRCLFASIRDADKLMTFEEVAQTLYPEAFKPGYELRASMRRSTRRALKKLIDDRDILALGKGGRGDPHRYCFNPIAFLQIKEAKIDRFEAGLKLLEGYPQVHNAVSCAAEKIAAERGLAVVEPTP